MNRLYRCSVLAVVVLAALLVLIPDRAPAVHGADEKKEEKQEKWYIDRRLSVTPQPAPVPALKHRLFPLASELKEGNAVPIYLRLAHERSDATRRRMTEDPAKWGALPLDQVPLVEARALLAEHRSVLQQLELGARRRSAEWNYTLDQESVLAVALPDAQSMRNYIRLLALKARVEIADGDFPAAVRTLETCFAFCRHVGEGPFLINGLVAVACAGVTLGAVTDFVDQPGAPNLYWALTALPRPLIDLRVPMEFEQRMVEMELPDLTDLGRKRTADQWDEALRRIRSHMQQITALERGQEKPVPAEPAPTEPAAKSRDLAAAKRYLIDGQGMKAATVDALPPAQVLVLFIAGTYRELSDDVYKASYLPYAESRAVLAEAEKRLKDAPDSEAARFARIWIPGALKARTAENRLERIVAALRTIEALRLHAANDGKLPDKLDDVTAVPVPNDPGTGKPFEYRKDGQTATLSSRLPGEALDRSGLRYTIGVRKK